MGRQAITKLVSTRAKVNQLTNKDYLAAINTLVVKQAILTEAQRKEREQDAQALVNALNLIKDKHIKKLDLFLVASCFPGVIRFHNKKLTPDPFWVKGQNEEKTKKK